jgi:hypothetical protein
LLVLTCLPACRSLTSLLPRQSGGTGARAAGDLLAGVPGRVTRRRVRTRPAEVGGQPRSRGRAVRGRGRDTRHWMLEWGSRHNTGGVGGSRDCRRAQRTHADSPIASRGHRLPRRVARSGESPNRHCARPPARARVEGCWAILTSGWAIGLTGLFIMFL